MTWPEIAFGMALLEFVMSLSDLWLAVERLVRETKQIRLNLTSGKAKGHVHFLNVV